MKRKKKPTRTTKYYYIDDKEVKSYKKYEKMFVIKNATRFNFYYF